MLTGIQVMVVDEADRMLDMGFIPDIERIFGLTPFTRQTLFFSATMPPEITRITDTFLSNPVRVEVARQATAAETVTQALYELKPSRKDSAPKEKRDLLRALVDAEAATGEWVGMLKLTDTGATAFRRELDLMAQEGSLREGDVPVLLNRLIAKNHKVRVQYITGQWLDIDDALDLARARNLL